MKSQRKPKSDSPGSGPGCQDTDLQHAYPYRQGEALGPRHLSAPAALSAIASWVHGGTYYQRVRVPGTTVCFLIRFLLNCLPGCKVQSKERYFLILGLLFSHIDKYIQALYSSGVKPTTKATNQVLAIFRDSGKGVCDLGRKVC